MEYTEENIGDIVDIETDSGSYLQERIVMVYCELCSANFIGPINRAGAFLARHDAFHQWEFKIETRKDMIA